MATECYAVYINDEPPRFYATLSRARAIAKLLARHRKRHVETKCVIKKFILDWEVEA